MTDKALLASKILVDRHRLHPCHVDPLAQVFERCQLQKIPEGRSICDEGGPASELFVLLVGRVGVKKKDYQGVAKELAVMKSPAVFGHMALVGKSLRTATCYARTDCQIAWLDQRLFDTLMQEASHQGEAFRWLIVSSMLMQHGKAAKEIQRLLTHAQKVDENLEELSTVGATLHGW